MKKSMYNNDNTSETVFLLYTVSWYFLCPKYSGVQLNRIYLSG